MAASAGPRPRPRPISILILGHLVLDVVLAPDRPLATGTDAPGRVRLRQGGSAANTARWAARLGAHTTLISAVGRDLGGRALVEAVAADGVTVRAARVAGLPSGRIGVVVAPGGERSFVADRGAADALPPDHLRAAWFRRIDAFHLPAYSLLSPSLAAAARAGLGHARAAGATISLDLASSLPVDALFRRVFERLGVKVHVGTPVVGVETRADGVAVQLGSGEVVEAGTALVAVGRALGSRGLGCDAAGISTGSRGAIVVNDDLRTSQPHIFAPATSTAECSSRMRRRSWVSRLRSAPLVGRAGRCPMARSPGGRSRRRRSAPLV